MTEPVRLDPLDRLVVCALQVNPRARWERLGATLGISDRTVARRVARLRELGALSFVALLDETRCGLGSTLHISASAVPGRTMAVAHALAERDDVRYVVTCAGSADVVVESVVADRAAQHRLLDVELPATPGLAGTRTQVILHTFKTVATWDCGLLTREQKESLRPSPRAHSPEQVVLSEDEVAICARLAFDGRATHAAVADAVGLSEPTVRRRVARLVRVGALHFRAEVEPRLLGFDVEAELRLSVPFDGIEEAGRLLAAHPAVRYVGATAGQHNLSVEAAFRHHDELYSFLTAVVPRTHAVATDVNLISTSVKRAGLDKRDGLWASLRAT